MIAALASFSTKFISLVMDTLDLLMAYINSVMNLIFVRWWWRGIGCKASFRLIVDVCLHTDARLLAPLRGIEVGRVRVGVVDVTEGMGSSLAFQALSAHRRWYVELE